MLKRVKRSWGGRTDKEIAEDVWEEHFERLEAYSKNNGGDANILWDGKNGDNELWEWVKEQRQAYGRRTNKKIRQPLSDERMARLEAIGLDLSEKATPRWDKMYAELVDYKEKHGDCYVPYHYKSERHGKLGVWVCSQKVNKRMGQMSSAKELKLAKLGFDFRPNSQWERHDNKRWESRLKEYVDYKATHQGQPTSGSKRKSLAGWCKHQQKFFSEGTLQQDRVDRLKDAGFIFDVGPYKTWEDEWNNKLNKLVQYKSTNNGKDPLGSEGSLGLWCREQRRQFRMGTLQKDRQHKLNGIEFDFLGEENESQKRTDWDTRYLELKQFYLEHGHCNVASADTNQNLAIWSRKQRKANNKSKLAEDRVSKLQAINFPFKIDQAQRDLASKTWDRNYGDMTDFYETNGHCNVGSDNPSLAKWFAAMKVSKLLSEYRRRHLLQLLDKDGTRCSHESCEKYALSDDGRCRTHACESSSTKDDEGIKEVRQGRGIENRNILDSSQWNSRYDELKQFYLDHGRIPVPSKTPHKSLSFWAREQRRNYRKSKLTEDRLSKLREIGFVFESGNSSERNAPLWEAKYQQLVDFHNTHGHFNNPDLRNWMHRQRDQFKKQRLSNDRMEKLRAIGFQLEITAAPMTSKPKREAEPKPNKRRAHTKSTIPANREQVWEAKYQQLAEFHKDHGHCRISKIHGKPTLFLWTITQRKAFRKNKLTPVRIEQLQRLGFQLQSSRVDGRLFANREIWKVRYGEMVKHFEKYGSCHVSKMHGNQRLLKWREKQLYKHKNWGRPNLKHIITQVTDDQVRKLQQIDFWSTDSESKPTCMHSDCNKFAAFGGSCHFHSNTTDTPCELACCNDDSQSDDFIADCTGSTSPRGNIPEENAMRDTNSEDIQSQLGNDGCDYQNDDFDGAKSIAVNDADQETARLVWDAGYGALNTYVQQHGRPPQTREEAPSLYDWLELQKARQRQMDAVINL